jgi:hypothetical protein
MTFGETLGIALASATLVAFLAWIGHYVLSMFQRRNEEAKYFRERLLERYSEFLSIAASELNRAGMIKSAMAIGSKGDWTEEIKMDEQRHTARLDLLRVSLQLKLFETDQEILDKLDWLAQSQPFMTYSFPPKWGEGNYDQRFEQFCTDIKTYETKLLELVNEVRKRIHVSDAVILSRALITAAPVLLKVLYRLP